MDLHPLAYAYTQLLSRLGAFDDLQNLLTVFLLGAVVGLALPACRRFAPAPVYCGALLVSLFFARLPWFLPLLPNPDEPQVLAGALRLLHHPVFWKSVDGTTNGPLNHYLLLLLKLYGLPLNLATARFANVLAWWAAMVFLYLAARLLLPEWAARLSVLPLLGAALQFRHFDFVQYSSECFPLALIACAVFLLARCHMMEPGKPRDWLLLGLVTASLPLAKLQSLPIAALLFGAGLASAARKWRGAAWLAAGAMLIVLPLFAMLAGFGLFHDSYESYLVNNLGYANRAEVAWTPATFADYLFQTPEMSRYLTGMLVFVGLVLLHALWRKARRPSAAGWVSIGLLLAGVYAVYRPGRPVPHYLLFLFVPLSVAAVAALAWELGRKRYTAAAVAVFAALTVALPFFSALMNSGRNSMAWLAQLPQILESPASRRLSQMASPGDTVVIWGWEPALYVLTGTVPGTRESQTQRQIEAGPQREYYRRRFLRDLKADPPKLFVDAVGPGRFAYEDRNTEGYESVPDLREYIDAHYELTDDIQNIRLFARRAGIPAPPSAPVELPLLLRCGGNGDAFFFGGAPVEFPRNDALTLPPVYLAERNCRQSCEYVVPVPDGTYVVKLHFIELSYGAPGARIFDVTVNESPVLRDFDIFREAGGAGRPLVKEVQATARRGNITIGFAPKLREAKINAIEIAPALK